jgi:hypothetical protein
MRCNRKILASLAAVGVSVGGLALATGAGASSIGTNSKATVTVGSKTYKLSGGACVVSASHIDLGIGSTKNTLGMNAAIKGGKFKNAQIGMVLGGTPLAITTDSGSATAKGGTFTGNDVISHSTVKGTFTC